MSTTRSSTRRAQRGAALLESLVGMLVLSIALLGSLLGMANGMRTQHVNSVRAQLVEQVRNSFQHSGASLCTGAPLQLQVGAQQFQAEVECTPYAGVGVGLPGTNAVTVSVPPQQAQIMTARVESSVLGGTLTVTSAQ